jgi:hypothetical protein
LLQIFPSIAAKQWLLRCAAGTEIEIEIEFELELEKHQVEWIID